jgi:hypothetical protein
MQVFVVKDLFFNSETLHESQDRLPKQIMRKKTRNNPDFYFTLWPATVPIYFSPVFA